MVLKQTYNNVGRWIAASICVLFCFLPVMANADSATDPGLVDRAYSYGHDLWSFIFEPDSVDADAIQHAQMRGLLIAVFLFWFVFASEDLSCISGGIFAAAGLIPLHLAILGCFLGIFVSDLLLYWLGRILGKGVFKLGFVQRASEGGAFQRMKRGFESNVFKVVVMTRFVPGSRVIAYITAGVLKVKAPRFTASLAIAALLWTPILVALAYVFGRPLIAWWEQSGWVVLPLVLVGLVLVYVGISLLTESFTYRGRRRLRGRWLRLTRWEYWPAWTIYFPVLIYGCFLALKYRSVMLWAACNPGMKPLSGLALESKSEILSALKMETGAVADWCAISVTSTEERMAQLNQFRVEHELNWPIVLKPDIGQRGEGVAIIHNEEAAKAYLADNSELVIAQRFIPGDEFGVFYYRQPGDSKGRIFSITEKVLPSICGDGVRSVERLILDDERAVAQAKHYLKVNADRLEEVIPKGECIQLVELGTHCRGAIFLDGNRYTSDALAAALDEVVSTYEGFFFGRFDVRLPSGDSLREGHDFKVLELNGVSSESTDIYDPKNSIVAGWKKLCRQWHLAFMIGAANRDAGVVVPKFREVIPVLRGHNAREPFEL